MSKMVDMSTQHLTDIAALVTAEWVAAHEDQTYPAPGGDAIDVDGATVFVSDDRTEAWVWAGNDADPDFEHQIAVTL